MKVEASVTINRPIEEVFAFVTNIEAQPQWEASALENKKLTEGPVRVGTRINHLGKFLGRRIETVAEVIEYEPNQKAQ